MTPFELFKALGELLPGAIEAEFGSNTNCILATRVAIEVATYFQIPAIPQAVQVVLMNRAFAVHVNDGDPDVRKWADIDGSHSVGIGCGFMPGQDERSRWDGHLIAIADGCFGDFSIQQAERPERGIITGPALVGPLDREAGGWTAEQAESGTVVMYKRTKDARYRLAPDWREAGRRKRLAAPIIRTLRGRS